MNKSMFASKTLWVNLIAVAVFAVQTFTGFVVPPEWQAGGLAVINFILRFVTAQPIV